jgi:hypothetical protein
VAGVDESGQEQVTDAVDAIGGLIFENGAVKRRVRGRCKVVMMGK